MARRRIKTTFNLKKLQRRIDNIIAWGLNDRTKRANKKIQQNLDKSIDIDDKPLEPLSPSRIAERAKKGTGSKPLVETGRMRKTKIIRATPKKLIAGIKMMGAKKGIYYGAMHNKGYIVAKGKFKGSAVPQRKWWGLHKSLDKNGEETKKSNFMVLRKIRRAWRKAGRM